MVGMVTGVWIGIVDCLERYLVYRLGWWLDWKRCPECGLGLWLVLARIN
jgi:hypothetical protein